MAVAAVAFSLGSKSEVGDKSGQAGAASAAASSKGATASPPQKIRPPLPNLRTPPVVAAPPRRPRGGSHGAGPWSGRPPNRASPRRKRRPPPKRKSRTGCRAGQPRPPRPKTGGRPRTGGSCRGRERRFRSCVGAHGAQRSGELRPKLQKGRGPTGAGRIAVTFANRGQPPRPP